MLAFLFVWNEGSISTRKRKKKKKKKKNLMLVVIEEDEKILRYVKYM